jgi:PAS domain S-box-containing protein
MKLQRYLTVVIWLCVIAVLALAVGLGYLQFRQARNDDGIEAQHLARTVAVEVDHLLRSRVAALQALSMSPLADEATRWPDLHREALRYRAGFGGDVALIDENLQLRLHTGVLYGAALPSALLNPHARRALGEALTQAMPTVSDTYDAAIGIAVPGLREGRTDFVLFNSVPATRIAGPLDELALPAQWLVALSDSSGQVIARRGGGRDAAGLQPDAGASRFTERLKVAPWTVEVQIPPMGYAQSLAGAASLLALAVLGMLMAGALGGQWAARRLTHSMRSLVQPHDAEASGDEIDEIREARRLLEEAQARREAAVEALREREELLHNIFESASEAIITADESQTIVLANPAAAKVFGRPIEQLVGAPLDSLIPERFRQRHHEDVEGFGRSDAGSRSMRQRPDVVGLRADGQEFPLEAAISQVHVSERRLYTVILRDVTERRQAEAAIAAGKARLEATLESMDDAVLMVDTSARVVDVNSAFVRMYGFEHKSQCLLTVADYQQMLELSTLDGRTVPPARWGLLRALRGEVGSAVELRVRRKDTGHSWIGSFTFAPIRNPQGEIIGAVFTVRDVTEQKRMEEELRVSHRDLKELLLAQQSIEEEERKRIARELHDELQQVLAAIKMDVGSIESELASDPARLPALIKRMDDLAAAAITSSRRIVSDLRPLLLEELGLVPALEVLARQFAERTGMRVSIDSDESCRQADGALPDAAALCLYRAAQEALNNAAKHSHARWVQLRLARTPAGAWRLDVTDDGRGLRPEDRRKLGSFGLRGMEERVRALGGTLRVDGEPGRGVAITVEIGASRDQVAA